MPWSRVQVLPGLLFPAPVVVRTFRRRSNGWIARLFVHSAADPIASNHLAD